MSKCLFEYGIVHKLTCVDTPQQNDIFERKDLRSKWRRFRM